MWTTESRAVDDEPDVWRCKSPAAVRPSRSPVAGPRRVERRCRQPGLARATAYVGCDLSCSDRTRLGVKRQGADARNASCMSHHSLESPPGPTKVVACHSKTPLLAT